LVKTLQLNIKIWSANVKTKRFKAQILDYETHTSHWSRRCLCK